MKHFLAVFLNQVLVHIFDHELGENAITRNFPCVKIKEHFSSAKQGTDLHEQT
jgi:hypothetical protein